MKRYITAALAIGALLPMAALAFSASSLAGVSGVKGVGFFGGDVVGTFICTCPLDPATILTVNDYATKRNVKVKFAAYYSKLNKNYNPVYPKYVIGGSMAGDTSCRQISFSGCTTGNPKDSDAVVDFWRGIGTSLKP